MLAAFQAHDAADVSCGVLTAAVIFLMCIVRPPIATMLLGRDATADYVLEGSPGTPFSSGFYYGKVKFPPEYPFKPPSIYILTPNGRFATNKRICMSMSDCKC